MPADVQQIIDRILASPRMQQNDAFANRTFSDEPILRRGSQMESYLPEKIGEMRALARTPEARTMPAARIFYLQARLMETYEDSIECHSTFSHYFPTYEDMGNRDLRRYFSWRTNVRHGKIIPTSLSFVFVLLYELLCGIGTSSPEDGFHKIEALWQGYRIFDPKLDRHVRRWLRDYAAWHGLPASLLEPYVDLDFDHSIVALRDGLAAWSEPAPGADAPGEAAIDDALDELSTYRPRNGRLHKDRPDTLRHVTCAALARLAAYYDKHRKSGLVETLFGSPLARPYPIFASAVFYSEERHPDAIYELDEINRYVCRNGAWYREAYVENRERSSKLGGILRVIDQRLRDAIGYEHPLSEKDAPKYLVKIIDEQIDSRLTWEREREARMVRIDLSQLEGIRADASITREALLVDEEREKPPAGTSSAATAAPPAPAEPTDAPAPISENSSPAPGQLVVSEPDGSREQADAPTPAGRPATETGTGSPYDLTADELALVTALLNGEPLPASSTSVDMLVDSVNEKLFDLLGDTALEFGADGPVVIEDYQQDVRGALLP